MKLAIWMGMVQLGALHYCDTNTGSSAGNLGDTTL